MKRTVPFILLGSLTLGVTACKEKPQQEDIIITRKKEAPKVQSGPLKMSDYNWSKEVKWIGKTYTVSIQRHADESLPKVKDESGREYFDNKVVLQVIRADGSVFFDRTFTKQNFSSFMDNDYVRDGGLLGIVFVKAVGDYLYFAGSVGSPDTMSDEYIPLVVRISRMGEVKVEKDTQLDSGNDETVNKLQAAKPEGR